MKFRILIKIYFNSSLSPSLILTPQWFALRRFQYLVLNGRIVNECRNGKDVEGSHCYLIEMLLRIYWSDWEKSWNTSVRIPGVLAEILRSICHAQVQSVTATPSCSVSIARLYELVSSLNSSIRILSINKRYRQIMYRSCGFLYPRAKYFIFLTRDSYTELIKYFKASKLQQNCCKQ